MNRKILNYVNGLFSDVPRTKKSMELKEEILSNMNERYNDYISEGKSENEAYSLVISNFGDIDEMLREVMPDAEFVREANVHRRKKGRNIAIAVMMYILSPFILVAISSLGVFAFGNVALFGTLGIFAMFTFVAIATGILIYTNFSIPKEYKDYNKYQSGDDRIDNMINTGFEELAGPYMGNSKEARMRRAISGTIWSIALLTYLAVSFYTGAWGTTWLIWIAYMVIDRIVGVIYEMRRNYE